jgi:hypothetical protein
LLLLHGFFLSWVVVMGGRRRTCSSVFADEIARKGSATTSAGELIQRLDYVGAVFFLKEVLFDSLRTNFFETDRQKKSQYRRWVSVGFLRLETNTH